MFLLSGPMRHDILFIIEVDDIELFEPGKAVEVTLGVQELTLSRMMLDVCGQSTWRKTLQKATNLSTIEGAEKNTRVRGKRGAQTQASPTNVIQLPLPERTVHSDTRNAQT